MAHRNHKPLWVFQHIPIVLVGAALIWFGFKVAEAPPALKRLVDDEPLRSIADALLVAGILTVVVDPFIKGHLYREVATGTFEYLLGFAQPREIQEAMRKLAFETTVYARNLKMNYVIERLNQHSVRLNVETAVRIENPSAQVQFYEPHLLFEEAENPTVNYIEVSSKEGTRRHDSGLRAEVGKPEVLGCHTSEVPLSPGESIHVAYKYSVVLPDHFFFGHHFGTRTIGVDISIDAPGFDAKSDLEWERKPRTIASTRVRGLEDSLYREDPTWCMDQLWLEEQA